MKKTSRTNPFPTTDSDRHAIWQALVERDIRAFLAQDWNITADDFQEDGFVGHSGSANPDDWRISYPSLDSYRIAWLEQARDINKLRLKHTDMEQFLFDATELTRIDINGDEALAHKKFNGRAEAVDAADLVLQWQTLYRLHRTDGQWRMTGFLGYLPNPMPGQSAKDDHSHICLPQSASEHKASGPYSPVLRVTANEWIVISGQGPLTPEGVISGDTFAEQAHLTIRNCVEQLRAADATLSDVFRVNVYLADLSEWSAFNRIYQTYFKPPYPARTAIQAVLWGGIQVEIDMMAAVRR